MANTIAAKKVRFLHNVGEVNPIYLDLTNQPEFLGSTGIASPEVITAVSSPTFTPINGDDSDNPLVGVADKAGTGDKTDGVVRITLQGGVENVDVLVEVTVTWENGGVIKYGVVVQVR